MNATTWILPSGIVVPVVQAQVTLLPELSHGRRLLTTGQYRPHIVIGPQSQRKAIVEGNVCREKYLGVMFVGGPEAMSPGESAVVSLALMYSPEKSYDEVRPDATFTIREGPLIVGFGVVVSPSQTTWNLRLSNRWRNIPITLTDRVRLCDRVEVVS